MLVLIVQAENMAALETLPVIMARERPRSVKMQDIFPIQADELGRFAPIQTLALRRSSMAFDIDITEEQAFLIPSPQVLPLSRDAVRVARTGDDLVPCLACSAAFLDRERFIREFRHERRQHELDRRLPFERRVHEHLFAKNIHQIDDAHVRVVQECLLTWQPLRQPRVDPFLRRLVPNDDGAGRRERRLECGDERSIGTLALGEQEHFLD